MATVWQKFKMEAQNCCTVARVSPDLADVWGKLKMEAQNCWKGRMREARSDDCFTILKLQLQLFPNIR